MWATFASTTKGPLRPSLLHIRTLTKDFYPPPGLDEWIKHHTSSPAIITTDNFDPVRATQLLRTLPTRSYITPNSGIKAGEPLAKGHHLIYFQPETPLCKLGRDGSSTVCSFISTSACSPTYDYVLEIGPS